MSDVIKQLALLKDQHYRPAGFNLFSILRKESDEVYLHSRYLAFLLNPQASHNAGSKLLELFLARMQIQGFDATQAKLQNEFRRVDILISNNQRQAVIIENKVHAPDQDDQLPRYHKSMQAERFESIQTIYLTLDGADPKDSGSKEHAPRTASYEHDIIPWLEDCLSHVDAPGVRESILQYRELLKKLTFSDQNEVYMQALKSELLKGRNVLLVKDIQKAYVEVQKDLQLKLWDEIVQCVEQSYPSMPSPERTATKEAVSRYYANRSANRFFGLYYDLGKERGGVYLELNHYLYTGYYSDAEEGSDEFACLLKLGEDSPAQDIGANGLHWMYTSTKLNLKSPSTDDLELLITAESREWFVQQVAGDLFSLWSLAVNRYAEVDNNLPLSESLR